MPDKLAEVRTAHADGNDNKCFIIKSHSYREAYSSESSSPATKPKSLTLGRKARSAELKSYLKDLARVLVVVNVMSSMQLLLVSRALRAMHLALNHADARWATRNFLIFRSYQVASREKNKT